jgi:hypothetical protein
MNSEEKKKQSQEYYKNNKEKLKLNSKKWRKENKAKTNESQKKWREKNKGYMARWLKNYREKNKDVCEASRKKSILKSKTEKPLEFLARRLFFAARIRAKSKKLDFNLTQEWIFEKLNYGKCCITNIPFKINLLKVNSRVGPSDPFSPSLDRINSQLGYTKENTQIVIWIYNSAKSCFSHDDVLILANALIKK